MRNCINWDSKKITLIRQLYLDQGYSAGMIARELERWVGGCFTRNSVMGKIHRLGLHKNGVGKLPSVNLRMKEGAKPKRKQVRIKPKPKAPPRLIFASPPTSGIACPCQLDELGPFNCHWPIGDPSRPEFYFCGAVIIPGKPYCPTHQAISLNADIRSTSFQPRILGIPRARAPWDALIGDLRQAAFKQAALPSGLIHEPT